MFDKGYPLVLHANSKAYQEIVFDIVRIFKPDFQWGEPQEGGYYIQIVKMDTGFEIDYNGHITVVHCEDKSHNERRRALKAALYRLFQEVLQAPSSHWGILTGIRPSKIVHRFWDEGYTKGEITNRLIEDFIVEQEKAELLTNVTALQRPYLWNKKEAQHKASVYIGIPFCPSKCLYCSFPSFAMPKPLLIEQYLDSLLKEMICVGKILEQQGIEIETIYVGGGTPTTLDERQLDRLLYGIWQAFGQRHLCKEFTVEAGRPDTITKEKLVLLHDYHVDRISINPQTMWAPTLEFIGRNHTPEDIVEKYYIAKEVGFKVINMDLIIGLPRETKEAFAYTLQQIAQLKPENLTVHTMALKRASRLKLEQKDWQSDFVVAEEMATMLKQWIMDQAYIPYYLYRQKQMVAQLENVGYTQKGYESLYNIQMMEEREHIIGFGVGAASKYINVADWTLVTNYNPKDLLLYSERIDDIIAKKADHLRRL